ncbi:MAG: transposase [Anaerolineaceae bacterium]|nr:MAG: transposase [Anaerolineaceae bacterium]
MPRKRREWYPNAVYHIVTRGNHKQNIFLDKTDYWQYIKYLRLIKDKHPFKLYSYCLMSNHIHLQIATIDTEIWTIMKGINWHYSKYFNAKYDTVGHLFQDRYYSEIIEKESYLLETSKYIHLNPVKACIVDSPIKYPWSSYGVYMGIYEDSSIYENDIMVYFQYNSELYKKYVESKDVENIDKEQIEEMKKRSDFGTRHRTWYH